MIDLNTVNEIYLYTGTTVFRYGIYGKTKEAMIRKYIIKYLISGKTKNINFKIKM